MSDDFVPLVLIGLGVPLFFVAVVWLVAGAGVVVSRIPTVAETSLEVARERYVSGEIEVDEFELSVERALRGYRGRSAPPEWVAADIDRIEKALEHRELLARRAAR